MSGIKTARRVLDHLAFLACVGAGIAVGVNDRPELGVSLIILGGLTLIADNITDLRHDVKALQAREPGNQSTESTGVWVAHGNDHSEHWTTTVFPDRPSALRHLSALHDAGVNYLNVGFLRYGDSLDKATEERP